MLVARARSAPSRTTAPVVTTFIFRVRNVPAALYKAMGGFATNGVNMTKLESYQLDGRFIATSSTPTSRATPTTAACARAGGARSSSPRELRILGVYAASPARGETGGADR